MEQNIFYFRESLEDSFIYKTFNNANAVMQKMIENLKFADILDGSYIEDQYRQIKRSSVSPLSKQVLETFDNGYIELRYSPDPKIRMPAPIPFIVRKSDNRIISTIFIKAFSGVQNNLLTIPTKNLYTIMEAAYLALQIQQFPLKLIRNTTLCKICMHIYTQMYMKILIKEYALSMDRPLCDKVQFCISRFFLEKIWGVTNGQVVLSYASTKLMNVTDDSIREIYEEYSEAGISDVQGLINFLANYNPRMKNLNIKYFIERWIHMYHAPALLAMDYLPYLLFTINSVVLGSFLVSQNALADIIKECPGMSHYYSELAKTFI